MNARRNIAIVIGLLMASTFAWWKWPTEPAIRPDSPTPRLQKDVYVWQREWTPAVVQAVSDQRSDFDHFVLLAAEISMKSSPPRVTEVHPDYNALVGFVHQVGIAVRVGPMSVSAGYDPGSDQTKLICQAVKQAIAAPEQAGISVVEVQLDFDCAESKLSGYRNWVAAVKSSVAPIPVVITALPSWLHQSSFTDLAREAGGFVMQVHSLHQPDSPQANLTLCDPSEAEQAVTDAAKIGVPFRVALPTYSYTAAFSANGSFIALGAEGPLPTWPEGTVLRTMRSDPRQIAPLVSTWTANPPPNLTGIIWYRLPVAGDAMNWHAVTLKAVMAGQVPKANVTVEIDHPEPQLADLYLRNTGNADSITPLSVSANTDSQIVISEGIAGFERLDETDGSVIFRDQSTTGRRIAPGERVPVGWLRLASDKEVHAHVIAASP